ncbi:MAG: DUF58 domain-containing protein [Verrucomicrobiota bacterium]
MPDPHDQPENLREILREVRKIEVTTRGLVQESFGGEYHSSFKGQGMDFDDLRPYQPGDEVRTIDWNTTARYGEPFIKKFVEEREMTVLLVIDVSASEGFGSIRSSKRTLATKAGAVFAFSALQNQDKVGLVMFSDEVESYVPARKGAGHVLRIIRDMLGAPTKGGGTNLTQALEFLMRAVKKKSLVILLSDFLTADEYEKELRLVAMKHDVVAVQIADPAEEELPKAGRLTLHDAETHRQVVVDTSRPSVREAYARNRSRWREELEGRFRRAGIDRIELTTDPEASILPALHTFFRRRGAMIRV